MFDPVGSEVIWAMPGLTAFYNHASDGTPSALGLTRTEPRLPPDAPFGVPPAGGLATAPPGPVIGPGTGPAMGQDPLAPAPLAGPLPRDRSQEDPVESLLRDLLGL